MSRSIRHSKLKTQGCFWPLLILGVGLVALLTALEVFPLAIADLIHRAWPVLLVLVTLLLDQIGPLRRVAPLITVAVAGLLLGGIIAAAYGSRVATERDDQVVDFQQAVEGEVERLRVTVEGLATAVEISPSVREEPTITAGFVGSRESQVTVDYTVEGEVGVFTLREARSSAIPMLEAVGRGRMRVELPLGMPVELDFHNADGTASLNLLGLRVSRLNVVIDRGDLLLSLPAEGLERRGDVLLSSGDVTVFVPEGLGLHLFTGGRTPRFSDGDYLQDPQDGSYLSRRYDDFAEQTELTLNVFSGTIQVE